MDRSQLAIVIPAYNEEKTIEKVVLSLIEFANVIVVNDCSTDNTNNLALRAGAIVVNHQNNLGYEGAINSGFKKAVELNCEYVLTFDADGQHDSKLVVTFFDFFKKNSADIVLGIRPQPARIAEKILALYSQIFFNVKDPLCGMKAYNINYYKSNGQFDRLGSIGFDLALSAKKQGARVQEVAVPIFPRLDAPRFGTSLRANYKIMKALFKIIRFYQFQNKI